MDGCGAVVAAPSPSQAFVTTCDLPLKALLLPPVQSPHLRGTVHSYLGPRSRLVP